MAYKTVSKEEFQAWAAKNPGKMALINGQETQIPMPQAQDLGFLGNLARGVTKPVRAVAAMPEYLFQALGAANKGQTGMEPGQFKSIFLTPEEEINWAQDPIKQGVKSSAGLASYALGGGAGVGKTAGARVLNAGVKALPGSLMGGLGYSREGKEFEDTLKGGAFGFALGSGLQGASEFVKKAKLGQKMMDAAEAKRNGATQQDIKQLREEGLLLGELQKQKAGLKKPGLGQVDDAFNITAKQRVKLGLSPNEAIKLQNSVVDDMTRKGLLTGTADDIANSFSEYLDMLGVDEAAVLAKYGDDLVSVPSVVSSVKKVKEILPKGSSSVKLFDDGLKSIFGKKVTIAKIPTQMTNSQVVALKKLVDDIGGGFEKVMGAGESTVVANKLFSKIRNESRNILSGNSAIDDYLQRMSNGLKIKSAVLEGPGIVQSALSKATTTQQKALGAVQKQDMKLGQQIAKEQTRLGGVSRQMADNANLGIKIPGTDAAIQTGIDPRTIGSGLQYNMGRALQGGGQVVNKLAQLGVKNVSPLAGLLGSRGQTPQLGTSGMSRGLGTPSSGQQMVQQYTFMDGLMEASQIFPNASESELMSLATQLVKEKSAGQGGPLSLTASEAKHYNVANASKSAMELLDQMEQMQGQRTPGIGQEIFSTIGDLLNTSDPTMLEYRNKIASIDLAISNLIAGTRISPEEEKKLRKLKPTMNDSPREAKSRLLELIQYGLGGSGTTYEQLGYNIGSGIGEDTSIADDYSAY